MSGKLVGLITVDDVVDVLDRRYLRIAGFIAYLWEGNPLLGGVLALALMVNLIVAAFVGSMVPFTLGRLGVDPAVAPNVFVTACTDICGFFSGNSNSILEVFLDCAIQRVIQEVKIPDLLSPCPTSIRLGEWLGKNKRHLLLRQATVRA